MAPKSGVDLGTASVRSRIGVQCFTRLTAIPISIVRIRSVSWSFVGTSRWKCLSWLREGIVSFVGRCAAVLDEKRAFRSRCVDYTGLGHCSPERANAYEKVRMFGVRGAESLAGEDLQNAIHLWCHDLETH